MSRFLTVLMISLAIGSLAMADSPQESKGEGGGNLEQLKKNPDDAKVFNQWLSETAKGILELIDSAPDDAQKKITEATSALAELKPATTEGKSLLTRAKLMLVSYEEHLALSRISLEDLERELDAKPNEPKAWQRFTRKVSMAIGSIARTEPEKADVILKSAKERVAKLKEMATEKLVKSHVDGLERSFVSFERTIEHGRRLVALVGTKASPLTVESWVNGSPLTADDLKGKVVLLDFWAVWCGPCIATFPHLREWQNQYESKGLVIVGLTRYYDYEWNETAGRAMRAKNKEDVPHDVEQQMLKRFAAQHNLHHRFAIQPDDSPLAQAYAVQGIPHAVLIDRQGIIRMVRVGSGPKNAKAIGDMISKLLSEPDVLTK